MKIKEAFASDIPKINNLVHTVLSEIFGFADDSFEDINNLNESFEKFWILEVDNKIIGSIGLKREESKGRVSRMYLMKECRGKGYGKILMNKLLDYCKDVKIDNIFLTTYEQMKSQKFYENCGFKTYKKDGDVIYMEKLK